MMNMMQKSLVLVALAVFIASPAQRAHSASQHGGDWRRAAVRAENRSDLLRAGSRTDAFGSRERVDVSAR